MTKKALICGVTGQDGAYLAKLLLSKEYEVWGTSRDIHTSNFHNLQHLGIKGSVNCLTMNPEDFSSVFNALRTRDFDEVYYLAGQTSVSLSFKEPSHTLKSIILGTLNILDSCRLLDVTPRIYFAGSSECFGDTLGKKANELTPFNPVSPYAVAKSSAFWLVNNYRLSYGLFVCTGILFNHESPLRPNHFVTQKIIKSAMRIAKGSNEFLELGRLDISRDWGWAPEYVNAMWQMLQLNEADDFVICTGQTNTLKEFVSTAFEYFGLNWVDHVRINPEFVRPSDILISIGDSSKAFNVFGWHATTKMSEVIKNMIVVEEGDINKKHLFNVL
jgi:GDPmannose 4,6-dehydratase